MKENPSSATVQMFADSLEKALEKLRNRRNPFRNENDNGAPNPQNSNMTAAANPRRVLYRVYGGDMPDPNKP